MTKAGEVESGAIVYGLREGICTSFSSRRREGFAGVVLGREALLKYQEFKM